MDQKLIDKAFKLFHEKKYQKAGDAFRQIAEDHDNPGWIRNRAKSYLVIIDKEMAGAQEDPPPTLTTITFHINRGDFDRAEEETAASDLEEDVKLFLRAQVSILQGDKKQAADMLKQAVELNKVNIGYALNEPSFAAHLKDDLFSFLTAK